MTDFIAKLRDLEDRLEAACAGLVERRFTSYVNSVEIRRVFAGWQTECQLAIGSYPALQSALAPFRGPDPSKYSDDTNFYTKDELLASARKAIQQDIDQHVERFSVKRRPREMGDEWNDGFAKRACV